MTSIGIGIACWRAVLTTLLGVSAELAAPDQSSDDGRIVIATRDSVNQLGQEMTRRNMNIQPTLTIRQGMPVRVVANRDSTLRPYRPLLSIGEAMVTTLRLGPLPKYQVVKLTVNLPVVLKDELDRYAAAHSQMYGEKVDAAVLVPHVLERFMATDRGFRHQAKA